MDLLLVAQNTDFLEFLSMRDKSELRCVCKDICQKVDSFSSRTLSWKDQCRMVVHRKFYRMETGVLSTIHLQPPLPSIAPLVFWGKFWRWCSLFVSLKLLQKWSSFIPSPVFCPEPVWCIHMSVLIDEIPDRQNQHVNDDDTAVAFPIAIGIFTGEVPRNHIGLTHYSIGYHSDDGYVCNDGIVIGRLGKFEKGDIIFVGIDYRRGSVYFCKRGTSPCWFPLHGEFLSSRLHFAVSMDNRQHKVRIRIMGSGT